MPKINYIWGMRNKIGFGILVLGLVLGMGGCEILQGNMAKKNNNLETLRSTVLRHSELSDSAERAQAQTFLDIMTACYASYQASDADILGLSRAFFKNPHLKIEIWGGNWCSDTHEGIPALMRVLDRAGLAAEGLVYHRVSRDKKYVDGLEVSVPLGSVPLVIITNEGRKLGEIVEFPRETWELNLLKIVSDRSN